MALHEAKMSLEGMETHNKPSEFETNKYTNIPLRAGEYNLESAAGISPDMIELHNVSAFLNQGCVHGL